MLRKLIIGTLMPLALGALALGAGEAYAQGQQQQPGQPQQPQQKQQKQQQQGQLSTKGQEAVVRLHALNQARAQFAAAAAEQAENPQAQQFLEERASEYMRADETLVNFARNKGVDLSSPQMQQRADKHMQKWEKKLGEIQQERDPRRAAQKAVKTFSEQNESAIRDLRSLRGEVQEPQLAELINERIAKLEQETTQAEQLSQRLQQQQQQQQPQQQQGQQQQPQT